MSFKLAMMQRPLPSDPQTRADVESVLKNGYIILNNSFSATEVAEAKAEMDRLTGITPEEGRNPFEGYKTIRIYSLLNKSVTFNHFVTT